MYLPLSHFLSIYFSRLLIVICTLYRQSYRHYFTRNLNAMSSINVQLTRNFNLTEFHCKNGIHVPPDLFPNALQLAINLQALRNFFDVPVFINSAYRTQAYNAQVGGSPHSQHLQCKAADIVIKGVTPIVIASCLEMMIMKGMVRQGGIGIYDTFVHYDVRGKRARWDFRKHKLSIPE